MNHHQPRPFRPYKHLTSRQVQDNLAELRKEAEAKKHLAVETEYYAPAIHYHEEELRRRGHAVGQ